MWSTSSDLAKAITSKNSSARKDALHELNHWIFEQGGGASPSALFFIPFLIEALKLDYVEEKEEILGFFGSLAPYGYPYNDGIYNYEPDKLDKEVFEQIASGIDVYLNLLKHPDPKIRLETIGLLANIKSDSSKIAPAFIEFLRIETDTDLIANCILALAILIEQDTTPLEMIMFYFQNTKEPKIKYAAALALAKFARQNTPPEAVELILDKFSPRGRYLNAYPGLSANFTHWKAIRYLGPDWNYRTIPTLLQLFETYGEGIENKPYLALTLTTLLYLAFDGQKILKGFSNQQLTDEQRQVLIAIVKSDNVWKDKILENNCATLLALYGLPSSKDKLQEFVE